MRRFISARSMMSTWVLVRQSPKLSSTLMLNSFDLQWIICNRVESNQPSILSIFKQREQFPNCQIVRWWKFYICVIKSSRQSRRPITYLGIVFVTLNPIKNQERFSSNRLCILKKIENLFCISVYNISSFMSVSGSFPKHSKPKIFKRVFRNVNKKFMEMFPLARKILKTWTLMW